MNRQTISLLSTILLLSLVALASASQLSTIGKSAHGNLALAQVDVSPAGHVLATASAASGTILAYTVSHRSDRLAAVAVQLENAIMPVNDLVLKVRLNGTERASLTLKGASASFNAQAYSQVDVGRRYLALIDEPLRVGDIVSVILTSGSLPASTKLRATLYSALPTKPLAAAQSLEWFRPHRVSGPLSKDTFPTQPTYIVRGSGVDLDPKSAPQNNSGIIKDATNGKFYQFTSFYARDEQHGGGLNQSTARVYGFRSRPSAEKPGATAAGASSILDWEPMNNGNPVVSLIPGSPDQTAYVGDPQIFKTLDNRCGLVYDTGNGSDLAHVSVLSTKVKVGKSCEDLPSAPAFTIYTRFKQNTEPSTVYCPRLVPRSATRDYLLILNYRTTGGGDNKGFKAFILPNLTRALTDTDWNNAPTVIYNNEEGGSMFTHDGRVYLTTWQIPAINSPAAVQRTYSAPLSDALNPGAWKVEPNSYWHTNVSDAYQDGGFTADSVAASYDDASDELYVTAVAWSPSQNVNYVIWSRQKWNQVFRQTATATLGVAMGMTPVTNPIEVPLGINGSIQVKIRVDKIAAANTGFNLAIGPDPTNSNILSNGQLILAVDTDATRLYKTDAEGNLALLTISKILSATEGTTYDVTFKRAGNTYTALSGSTQLFQYTVTDPLLLTTLRSQQARWKIGAGQGILLEILDVTLAHH